MANSFDSWKLLYDENSSMVSWDLTETDEHLHNRWFQEFCRQIPDRKIQRQIEEIIKQQYQEKGLEDPTETDIV